jgi:hypothetical protein
MQKHGERERERASERKKYFQNLGTKVCVILFLKSLLMRASVRPSVLLGCCKFVLACMRCQSPPLEETQGILVMQSSTAALLILLRPPKVCYLLFAKARKSPLQKYAGKVMRWAWFNIGLQTVEIMTAILPSSANKNQQQRPNR